MLRVASSIMSAIVVHPGGECSEGEMEQASRELMARATALSEAAFGILQVRGSHPDFAAYKAAIRQQAAEVVAAQWRMANATGAAPLTIEQMSAAFQCVMDLDGMEDAGTPDVPPGIDGTTARRMALLGVVPEVYSAVTSFDYFHPSPPDLVEQGVREVLGAATSGLARIAAASLPEATQILLTRSLISRAGALYAANYRACARRDVLELERMDDVRRQRLLYEHRGDGLPTGHIDQAFRRLMARMVNMVCEQVPELSQAPGATTTQSDRRPSGTDNRP